MTDAKKSVRLVPLSPEAIAALADDDLARASGEVGIELPEFLLTDRWLWELRRDQIAKDPGSAGWVARVAMSAGPSDGLVVGYAGFHGPPDEAGVVEVGYTVLPEHRRQGYARAILSQLLRQAAAVPEVRTVRASINPDNAASLATIAGFGFAQVGDQWDEEDGLELLFEVPAGQGLT